MLLTPEVTRVIHNRKVKTCRGMHNCSRNHVVACLSSPGKQNIVSSANIRAASEEAHGVYPWVRSPDHSQGETERSTAQAAKGFSAGKY